MFIVTMAKSRRIIEWVVVFDPNDINYYKHDPFKVFIGGESFDSESEKFYFKLYSNYYWMNSLNELIQGLPLLASLDKVKKNEDGLITLSDKPLFMSTTALSG